MGGGRGDTFFLFLRIVTVPHGTGTVLLVSCLISVSDRRDSARGPFIPRPKFTEGEEERTGEKTREETGVRTREGTRETEKQNATKDLK